MYDKLLNWDKQNLEINEDFGKNILNNKIFIVIQEFNRLTKISFVARVAKALKKLATEYETRVQFVLVKLNMMMTDHKTI